MDETARTEEQLKRERLDLLQRLDDWLERPMVVLAFAWLALFVIEMLRGLGPLLSLAGNLIWGIFIFDFGVRFALAPDKSDFLRRDWLTGISLLLPALRIFRVLRFARLARVASAGRGVRLLRALTSINRGMRALGASMGRRGLGYVLALTLIVLIAGSAAMYAFENNPGGRGLDSYGAALWWTAMIMTTLGSDYWPLTPAGRVLCFLLSLYSLAVFGYLTAALATFFVGRDAEDDASEIAGAKQIEALRAEIGALREELRQAMQGDKPG